MASTILVVDDDPATRQGLTRLLESAGYSPIAVGDVPTALQILTERTVDLLITDIRLHAYNGLHLIAMAPRPIPAIVVTGFDDRSIEADARRLGADYLVKPVTWASLRELIARKLPRGAEHAATFPQTRRDPRRTLKSPVSVQVGPYAGRLLDASAHGARLEVHSAHLPSALTLRFHADAEVPLDVVWQRRTGDTTCVCGAAISDATNAQWQLLIESLV